MPARQKLTKAEVNWPGPCPFLDFPWKTAAPRPGRPGCRFPSNGGWLWGVIFTLPFQLYRVLDLHSLLAFLTAAPKTYVIKLHRRENPGEGLMQAAKVIHLVYDWALRRERIEKVLEEVEGPGKHLLALVYVAEERGATESELLTCVEGSPPARVIYLLGKLEQELLIFPRQGDNGRIYHGFEELVGLVLPTALPALWHSGAEGANWVSYRHFLTAHLCHFLCQVALGEIKITQNGEMHRKNQQELALRFTLGEKLSSAIPGEEVQFLLHFTAQTRLVLQEEGRLHLSDEGKALLRGERREASRQVQEWWMKSRVKGMERTLAALGMIIPANAQESSGRIATLADLLWIYTGQHRKQYHDTKASFTWESLPKVLQELWLLGFVDFGMSKGRIGWVRLDRKSLLVFSSDEDPHGEESASSRPISLPNMESLVPILSPLAWLARLEMVGRRSNDEFMTRYRFSKESVIQGLQAGLEMGQFKELLRWLGFEGPAAQTLVEWASTYASTLFMDALILKVSDAERFRELQEIPEFLALVGEVIPGFGFVVTRQNKPRIKELLQHFGLVPGEDFRKTLTLEPVVLDQPGYSWALPVPETGAPAYRESPTTVRIAPHSNRDERGQLTPEQEAAQRIGAIESAISEDKKIEFNYHSPAPRRITLQPILLIKQKSPVKLIGIEVDTGHRNEYMLDQVKSLRIVE